MFCKKWLKVFFNVLWLVAYQVSIVFAMEDLSEEVSRLSISDINRKVVPKHSDSKKKTLSVYNRNAIHGTIAGFPEFLPGEQIIMQKMINHIRRSYEKFGFIPLETPSVEKIVTLQSKGIEGKEVYGLRRLNVGDDEADDGRKELALRFDLTVPLARYISDHYRHLNFPFRRYQIQPVWRGEKPSAGRYREFYQCDIDVVGQEDLSLGYDAELPLIIYQTLKSMDIGPFIIRINNRKVLEGLFSSVGLEGAVPIKTAIKVIDNIEKVSTEETQRSLGSLGVSSENISKLMELFSLDHSQPGSIGRTLDLLKSTSSHFLFEQGIKELETVVKQAILLGVPEEYITVDPSIARGLDYYTGTIYETELIGYPQLGSICSGGRYDNLAGCFTDKKLPGVGVSIGLTRFIPQLFREGVLDAKVATIAPILITTQNLNYLSYYYNIASIIRKFDVPVEVYLQQKKLKKQLEFANKKGFSFAIIANANEVSREEIIIRSLKDSKQETISLHALEDFVLRNFSLLPISRD